LFSSVQSAPPRRLFLSEVVLLLIIRRRGGVHRGRVLLASLLALAEVRPHSVLARLRSTVFFLSTARANYFYSGVFVGSAFFVGCPSSPCSKNPASQLGNIKKAPVISLAPVFTGAKEIPYP
jgi:hypothetical protein